MFRPVVASITSLQTDPSSKPVRSAPPKPWRELPQQSVRHNVTNRQPEWHSSMRREVWQHLGEEAAKADLA